MTHTITGYRQRRLKNIPSGHNATAIWSPPHLTHTTLDDAIDAISAIQRESDDDDDEEEEAA